MLAKQSIFSYNHAKTEQVRVAKAEATPPIIRRVNRGQSIVRKGDRVDGTQAVVLEALVEQEESVKLGCLVSLWLSWGLRLLLSWRCICLHCFIESCLVNQRVGSHDYISFQSEMVGLGVGANALWYATLWPGGAMVLRILTNSETTLVWVIAMALFLAGMEQDVFFAGFFVVSGVTTHLVWLIREIESIFLAGLQTGLIGGLR